MAFLYGGLEEIRNIMVPPGPYPVDNAPPERCICFSNLSCKKEAHLSVDFFFGNS